MRTVANPLNKTLIYKTRLKVVGSYTQDDKLYVRFLETDEYGNQESFTLGYTTKDLYLLAISKCKEALVW